MPRHITTTIQDGIGHVRLSRPDKLNALTLEMLDGLVDAAREVADAEGAPVVLDVRTDNAPALALYRAHGFEVVGLRPRYYRPSMADAHLMVRPARGGGADRDVTGSADGGGGGDTVGGETVGGDTGEGSGR